RVGVTARRGPGADVRGVDGIAARAGGAAGGGRVHLGRGEGAVGTHGCLSYGGGSAGGAGHAEAAHAGQLAHELVVAAAEGDHDVALVHHVEPALQRGGGGVGGVAEAAQQFLGDPSDALDLLGGEIGRAHV